MDFAKSAFSSSIVFAVEPGASRTMPTLCTRSVFPRVRAVRRQFHAQESLPMAIARGKRHSLSESRRHCIPARWHGCWRRWTTTMSATAGESGKSKPEDHGRIITVQSRFRSRILPITRNSPNPFYRSGVRLLSTLSVSSSSFFRYGWRRIQMPNRRGPLGIDKRARSRPHRQTLRRSRRAVPRRRIRSWSVEEVFVEVGQHSHKANSVEHWKSEQHQRKRAGVGIDIQSGVRNEDQRGWSESRHNLSDFCVTFVPRFEGGVLPGGTCTSRPSALHCKVPSVLSTGLKATGVKVIAASLPQIRIAFDLTKAHSAPKMPTATRNAIVTVIIGPTWYSD